MNDKPGVRVGVVGCGWWATYAHLPGILEHPRATLAGLVDADPARLEAAGRRFGSDARFADVDQLLDGVALDAVVVAAPNALHHPVALAALRRGKHVLLEKPMVIEPAHGSELIAMAERENVHLIVGYPMHYNAQALALRDTIARGRIGTVEHVACLYGSTVRELYRGDPEAYRDAVFEYPVTPPAAATYRDPALAGGGQGQSQVSHAAALLLFLTGLRPDDVAAFTSNFGLAVDLADTIAIRFEGGALGTISSTGGLLPGHDEIVRCEIFGEAGHITFDVNAGLAAIHDRSGVEWLPVPDAADRCPAGAPVRNLVDAALGQATNGSRPEIGLRTAELVAAMYRSARDGRVVAA